MENRIHTQLLEALKTAYQGMTDVNAVAEYTKVIEPLLAGVDEGGRRRLGEALWSERRARPQDTLYPYTGLAFHLSPPAGGS